jgi:hypothetical protein
MKTILFALVVLLASCSVENDPEPQASCEQLKAEIQQIDKQLEAHYAKGSQGNQSAWETELNRLIKIKTPKVNEAKKRLCQ